MAVSLLIVGLGNPGSRYSETKHNIGFEVIQALARELKGSNFREKFQSLSSSAQSSGKSIELVMPQTYMNLSGDSISQWVNFYKLDPSTQLIVISDDLDLPCGRLRLRKSGGSGGHNGLKSVIERLGTEDFARLRIGIGRVQQMGAKDQVLAKVSGSEKEFLAQAADRAVKALKVWIEEGVDTAMNRFNVDPSGV